MNFIHSRALFAAAIMVLALLTPLPSSAQVAAVATSNGHTCAVLEDGSMKCWGDNTSGKLGIGDTAARGDAANEMGSSLPYVVLTSGIETVSAMDLGLHHTCAILSTGDVKCWGAGTAGKLGLGDTTTRGDASGEMGDSLPTVDLGSGRTATSIASGKNHNCVVLDNSTVKCWGEGGYGRLGLGDQADRGDGGSEMGDNLPAASLGTGRTAAAVSAGELHSCALLDDDTVKCWGNNAVGALGLGDASHRGDAANEMGDNLPAVTLGSGRTAVEISAGSDFTCAILDNATVKCWGENAGGRLGLGDTTDRGDGASEMGDNLPAVSLGTGRTATAIAAGSSHACAILDNGTVKCWGANANGQLGLGDTSSRGDGASEMGDDLPTVSLGTGRTAIAISARTLTTCALLDNYTVKCWGSGSDGRLGQGDTTTRGDGANEMGDNLPAIVIGTPVRVASQQDSTCVERSNASVKCWGTNPAGQLGLGDTASRGDGANEMGSYLPTVDLASGFETAILTAAGNHACAASLAGTAKCWGFNLYGQLGLGDANYRGDGASEMGSNLPTVDLGNGAVVVGLSTPGNHSCALLDGGTVKCWGLNDYGQLGLGDANYRGDGANEMGANLPTVSLGTGRTAKQVVGGTYHTCALLDNDTVKCWGGNSEGQLGLGDTSNRGDGASEMGDNLPAVSLGTGRTARQIIGGSSGSATCAILDDASLKCWGRNASGELGLGDTNYRGDGSSEMGDNLPTVDLGSGRTAKRVAVTDGHACAVLDNGTVKCWGANTYGGLGLGDTSTRGDGSSEMGDNLPAVSIGTGRVGLELSAGQFSTCVVLDNNTVKCWGQNASGELGLGDTSNRGDGGGEMGDSLPAVDLGP